MGGRGQKLRSKGNRADSANATKTTSDFVSKERARKMTSDQRFAYKTKLMHEMNDAMKKYESRFNAARAEFKKRKANQAHLYEQYDSLYVPKKDIPEIRKLDKRQREAIYRMNTFSGWVQEFEER